MSRKLRCSGGPMDGKLVSEELGQEWPYSLAAPFMVYPIGWYVLTQQPAGVCAHPRDPYYKYEGIRGDGTE